MSILIFLSVVPSLMRCPVTMPHFLCMRCANAAIRKKHSGINTRNIICVFKRNIQYFLPSLNPPDAYHRFSIDRGHRVSIYINLVYLYCVNYLVGLEILKLKMEGFLNGVGGVRGNYARLPTNCLSTGIFHIFKTSYTSPTRR